MDTEALVDEVRRLPPRAPIAREAGRLRREEFDGSLAIAGTPLAPSEVAALLERGLALGGHALEHYLAARDLATAAAWVSGQRSLGAGDPRPLLTVEELRRLHGLSSAGRPAGRPGAWRLRVDPPRADVVSPAPWAVPFETAALVERVRRRPRPGTLTAWLASFVARFARIRPFTEANGRTGRLAASLLLRRLDAPPAAFPRERAAAYTAAVLAAESGRAGALTALFEEALAQSCLRLIAAANDDALVPLRDLAGETYAALIKAAKRGRLPTVTRNGRILTTARWIDAYAARRVR